MWDFAKASAYPYRPGSLYLGFDHFTGQEVGIQTERHAITVAGAGSGKSVALLIPNALRWPHGLLIVDPKGEVAAATWQAREALGQQVAVLDPFRAANVPDRLRVTFNPLSALDPSSLTAREDIRVIADGLVKRNKPEDEDWYAGAVTDLAGVIAFVVENPPPNGPSFAAMRSVLMQPDELKDAAGNLVGGLAYDAQLMTQSSAFGGLARAAGVSILTALSTDKGRDKSFLSDARSSSEWMESPAMAAIMAASSFRLSDLKAGKLSLFLVLPPKYIEEHSTFLRLFVRLALEAMMQEGVQTSGRCLFLLDEFYSLGRLDIIAKAAGLMRGYGLTLWPFLQDLGQLRALYKDDIAGTFFANADAAVFFGNESDPPTLDYISRRIGNVTATEVRGSFVPPSGAHLDALARKAQSGPTALGPKAGNWEHFFHDMAQGSQELNRAAYINAQRQHEENTAAARAAYEHDMRRVGTPRMTPSEIARFVGKREGDTIAMASIVFAKAGDVVLVRLLAYFQHVVMPEPAPALPAVAATRNLMRGLKLNPVWSFFLGLWLLGMGWLLMANNPGGSGPWLTGGAVAFVGGLLIYDPSTLFLSALRRLLNRG